MVLDSWDTMAQFTIGIPLKRNTDPEWIPNVKQANKKYDLWQPCGMTRPEIDSVLRADTASTKHGGSNIPSLESLLYLYKKVVQWV